MTPDYAWAQREGRITRYNNKRVGGTICVHFIKKNMWYLETALAFLETQDTTELEMRPSEPDKEEGEPMPPGPGNPDSNGSRLRPGSPPGHREDPIDVEPDLVDPDATKGHDVPMMHNKGMHVLLVQPDSEGLHIDVEGVEGRRGGSVVLPVDRFELSEGILGGETKRGPDSGALGERDDEETVMATTAGHFANGSRRVNTR